jgi:hypothetical protein
VDGSAPATRGPWAGGHDLPITAIVCGVSRVECDGLTWPANRTDPHDATHLLLALPISIWANEILLSIVRSTSANVPLALSASRRTASQCHAEQLEQQAKDFLCLQLEMANIRVPLQSDFDRLTIPWFQYGQAVGGTRRPLQKPQRSRGWDRCDRCFLQCPNTHTPDLAHSATAGGASGAARRPLRASQGSLPDARREHQRGQRPTLCPSERPPHKVAVPVTVAPEPRCAVGLSTHYGKPFGNIREVSAVRSESESRDVTAAQSLEIMRED